MSFSQSTKLRLLQLLPLVQQEIANEQGSFTLFVMLQRDNSLDLWDIVVSAPWIGESTHPTLLKVIAELKRRLDPADMLTISRVVVLRSNEPFVKEMLAYLHTRPRTDTPYIELANEEIYGVEYRRGYILEWDAKAPWMPETTPIPPKRARMRKPSARARA